METHPPKLIERLVGMLIPEPCREHVLGDLYERYKSPVQYILEALATLPFVLASRLRRTFRLQIFMGEVCVLYIAFAAASLSAGPAYLYDQGLWLPVIFVIAVILFVLVIGDVYAAKRRSPRRLLFQTMLALAAGWASKSVLGVINADWALPVPIVFTGITISLPLLHMVRSVASTNTPDDAAISGGGTASLDELRRRSTQEYQTARRVRGVWLLTAVLAFFMLPKNTKEAMWWDLGIVLLLLTALGVKSWRSQHRAIDDPRRRDLEQKRDDLLFWAGASVFGLMRGTAPVLVLLVIAFPLFLILMNLLGTVSWPVKFSPVQGGIVFGVFVMALLTWLCVRDASMRAVRAIRQELDALDRSEDKKQ